MRETVWRKHHETLTEVVSFTAAVLAPVLHGNRPMNSSPLYIFLRTTVAPAMFASIQRHNFPWNSSRLVVHHVSLLMNGAYPHDSGMSLETKILLGLFQFYWYAYMHV